MRNFLKESSPEIKLGSGGVQFGVGVLQKHPRVRRSMKITVLVAFALFCCQQLLRADEIEWTPEANMDHQLFPALIIATATVRPVEPEDEEAEKPDPYLLGERLAWWACLSRVPRRMRRSKSR